MKSTALAQSSVFHWWNLAAVFGVVSIIGATVILWLWMVLFALQWAAPHLAPAAS